VPLATEVAVRQAEDAARASWQIVWCEGGMVSLMQRLLLFWKGERKFTPIFSPSQSDVPIFSPSQSDVSECRNTVGINVEALART
jgi:hypothetical protein